jgi:hypothetical protein
VNLPLSRNACFKHTGKNQDALDPLEIQTTDFFFFAVKIMVRVIRKKLAHQDKSGKKKKREREKYFLPPCQKWQ